MTRVKSKGFIIGTILTPLLLAALLLLPSFVMSRGTRTDFRIIILDQTGDIALYERARELLLIGFRGVIESEMQELEAALKKSRWVIVESYEWESGLD